MSTMLPYGNTFKQILVTLVLSPAQVAINTTVRQTFACPGVNPATDTVVGVSKPTLQAGLLVPTGAVTAADTVGLDFINNTGGAITPTAGETYSVLIVRRDASQANFQ